MASRIIEIPLRCFCPIKIAKGTTTSLGNINNFSAAIALPLTTIESVPGALLEIDY